MAKSEKGKEIYKLYRKLDGLKSNARHLKCNLIDCKETAKGFKFSPYSFYDYSPRAKFIPIIYFGKLIGDFKQCYVGGGATKGEILRCIQHAEKDDNVLTMTDTNVKPISTEDGNISLMFLA